MKFKSHLDKLERYGENLPFFEFKYDFNAFCYFKFPDFENLYIFLTMNKGSGVLELVVLLKLARVNLQFVILLSLRGKGIR